MQSPFCEAKTDRVIIFAALQTGVAPPTIYGYQVVCDTFVRPQARVKTYLRVRVYRNRRTGVHIYLLYQPVLPGLAPFKVTVIGNDHRGLSYEEIYQIIQVFATYRVSLIEVALDFSPESHINFDHVLRHALFGKSRPRSSRRFPGKLRYGGRRSDKLVRCYRKPSIGRFRVELELHSALLLRLGIVRLEDLKKLPASLYPSHIRFVCVDWQALKKHLLDRRVGRMQGDQPRVAPTASIHKTMAFLRQCAGVKNVHRFLLPMRINKSILRAMKNWARSHRK
jgi:hypothetical protein